MNDNHRLLVIVNGIVVLALVALLSGCVVKYDAPRTRECEEERNHKPRPVTLFDFIEWWDA